MSIYQSKNTYKLTQFEKVSSDTKTHQTGYIPPKIKINEMILAGKRLIQAREEQYDVFKENNFEVPITRIRGVDMSEVIQKGKELKEKALKARKDAEKALAEAKENESRRVIEEKIRAELLAKTEET